MSWSSRNRPRLQRHARRIAACLLAAMSAPAPGFAAQVYIQPSGTVTAENDSNLDLQPGPNAEVQGYLVDAAALFGIDTPNSDSIVKARIDYRDYPKDSGDDRLEGALDFRSDYSTQRSHAAISGLIDHQDDFNSEFAPAQYNEINPVLPTSPSTGRAVVGETVTNVLLLPSYSYRLSPIISAGVSGIFQDVHYTPALIDHADFDYYLGKAFIGWDFSQRSELSFGGFGSKYKATQIDSTATGGGGSVGLDTSWTPLLSTSATVTYQRTMIDMPPTILNSEVGTWGATFGATYKAQVSQYRLNLVRIVTPTGGGVYVNEQAQFQYTRNFTQRWLFTGAAIYIKSSELPSNVNENDRNYLQTVVDLKWMITPTWFVQGGYQYSWEKYESSPDGGANNRVYIRFGYQGLNPQR
jgi:hypothetical protein